MGEIVGKGPRSLVLSDDVIIPTKFSNQIYKLQKLI